MILLPVEKSRFSQRWRVIKTLCSMTAPRYVTRIRPLVWLSVLFLLSLTTVARSDADVGEAFLSDLTRPDVRVLRAAQLGLEKYRDTRQHKDKWIIQVDEQKGVIETNWFPEHKGEVKLKVQIVVWGDSFRVDAWQRIGWLFTSVKKTDWSRRTERHIQDSIKGQLTEGK